jgi:hypothetical protein
LRIEDSTGGVESRLHLEPRDDGFIAEPEAIWDLQE